MNSTFLTIDLKKIKENWQYYQKINKKVIVVLKNNAYGLGMVRIARELENENIEMYAVNSLSEAKLLRDKGIKKAILLLGLATENDLKYCHQENISLTIGSTSQFDRIKNCHYPLKVHLKIDTGMHRIGITCPQLIKMIKKIKNSNFILTGIYTHYIGGLECREYVKQQQILFDKTLENIDLTNLLIHDCSTNSVEFINSKYANTYRLGMGLYNHSSCLKINAPIINIIKVKKYQCVSYDCSFVVPEDGYVFTVPFGYGDGWRRDIPLLHHQFIQAGLMTMNNTIFFSKNYPNVKSIIILGDKGNTLEDYQAKYAISAYEILSSLSPYIARIHR